VIVKVRERLGGEQQLLAKRTVQVPATRPVLTSPVLRHTASQALLVYRLGLFPYMWVLRATSKIVLNDQYLIISPHNLYKVTVNLTPGEQHTMGEHHVRRRHFRVLLSAVLPMNL
jgi:hypothetical protein